MLRLLIVDDEQIIREALSEMIDYASIGYELVGTARNGMEAYDIICDEYPDVVITDIKMPILNGLELIERTRMSDSNISFILLSGFGEFEYAHQAMKFGVRYYLLKPTDKNELVQSLLKIKEERESEAVKNAEKQHTLLSGLKDPLEQSFITEALRSSGRFDQVFEKYDHLLKFPENSLFGCVVSFLEEKYLSAFTEDLKKILAARDLALQFPLIYVKNSAVLILPANTLSLQENLKNTFEALQYPNQKVSPEAIFFHTESTRETLRSVIGKIIRYDRILLVCRNGAVNEIRNDLSAPWHIDRIGTLISEAKDSSEIRSVIDALFNPSLPTDTAKNIALSLFLKMNPESETRTVDIACDFMRKLYSCNDSAAVRELMDVVLCAVKSSPENRSGKADIGELKSYVKQHLDSENLSLKWLAENYLYVSVGYLSKAFAKEEGIRFSEYLNNARMEEAVRLMDYYHNDNIKSIAMKVGFGNNPQYFSQVFRKYKGCTPTSYIEAHKNK
jgi:two-component system response regulator YesN